MIYSKNRKPRTIEAVHNTTNLKNSKGITLIALVITIIVLLVLAGATLEMISGENGILKKVVQAKESTQKASVGERVKLAIQSALVSDYNEHGKITKETLIQELEKNGLTENDLKEIESNKWVLAIDDKKYVVYSDGKTDVKSINNHLLPSDYQELEYIESTGTQYIDIGVYGKSNYNLAIEFEMTNCSESFTRIFGCRDTANSNMFCLFKTADNQYRFDYGTSHTFLNEIPREGEKINLSYKGNQLFVNDSTYTVNRANFICSTKYFLCWNDEIVDDMSVYESQRASMKLYRFTIENTIDLIPCKSTQTVTNADNKSCPTGTIGLFDLVERKFYTNKNTTGDDFTPGEEIE